MKLRKGRKGWRGEGRGGHKGRLPHIATFAKMRYYTWHGASYPVPTAISQMAFPRRQPVLVIRLCRESYFRDDQQPNRVKGYIQDMEASGKLY